ncbi:MAG: DegV family protein [Christensenellales bacterium]
MEHAIQPLTLYGALLGGARRVEGKRDELNRINGFPVPDRDTGNNLAYLMQALRRQLPKPETFDDLFSKLSEASLLSARGNSGAIFSQFFAGFHQAAAGLRGTIREGLPLRGLADLFHQGYLSAYRSIQAPREGTILSAMHSFSEAFHQLLGQGLDLARAAEGSLSRLRGTVRESVTLLPQQRALNAPDAGAMAFLYFTEGFMHTLLGQGEDLGAAEDEAFLSLPAVAADSHVEALDAGLYRWCTEVLLRKREGASLDETLKARLGSLGDSLVVSGSERMLRIHIHTDKPEDIVDLMEDLGAIQDIKADDMRMQQALAIPHPGKVALVIDSIADVPEELLGEDVYCLPMHLMAEGVSYQDKRSISAGRMRRLSGKLSSSQLNLEEIRQFLDPITACYDQVLILSVSSKMSGLHARYGEYLALGREAKIRLVDSRVNSGAEGLLALHAARRLKAGAGLDEVAGELETLRGRTRIFVSVPDLKAMVASGRLNRRVGALLQALGFLPLITINQEGEGAVTGLSFSRGRSDRLLLEKLRAGRVASYAVVHAHDPDRAAGCAGLLEKKIGFPPSYLCEISSVVANFAGEGAYAVAYIENGEGGKA